MNHNMEMTEKTTGSGAARWGFYLMGLLILAMGLTLNTKAGLGVSPIISLSYAASVIWNRNFGDMTFVLYGIFVLIQAAIHLREKGKAGRSLLMKDALQFPLSIVFTRFLNVFSVCIPSLEECGSEASGLLGRLGVLMLALIFTGIGAAGAKSGRWSGAGVCRHLWNRHGSDEELCGCVLHCSVTDYGTFVCGKTGGNRHWNGLCCHAGGARDCAVSSYFWKGDAAGGWTGKWQELTECVEKNVSYRKEEMCFYCV